MSGGYLCNRIRVLKMRNHDLIKNEAEKPEPQPENTKRLKNARVTGRQGTPTP